MNFIIISHVTHKLSSDTVVAYAPYVIEMNLWIKRIDKVQIIAPILFGKPLAIDLAYQHHDICLTGIPAIQFTSVNTVFRSFFKLPKILILIFKACQKADHIHLRCPGNIGLLGCFVQIFFPKTPKTAKYAGNWDPEAKQPLSYKVQKWILSNTFLTKNMQVLVYGDWEHQSKNIKPFFTATYTNDEKEKPTDRNYTGTLKFVFVGTLTEGKRPILAIQIIEALRKKGKAVILDIYGEGVLKESLQHYITTNNLEGTVTFHGNQPKAVIKSAFKSAHFSILASKSEGWPKALAEAMFFGAIPVATPVSCVPYMLGFGKRGILLIEPTLNDAVNTIMDALKDVEKLQSMSSNASNWSQNYTLDAFETEIVKLLNH